MHEMSITKSMLEAVREEMDRNGMALLRNIKIRVGELTAVEPEALRFCFEASTKGTPMQGAALEIEEVPLTGKCLACGTVFRIEGFRSSCPSCGAREIERLTGTELDIVSIEAE